MKDFTTIQLLLPNDFNYKLDVYLAKLKRDGHMKKDKTKAQVLISLAEKGLLSEVKNMKITVDND